MRDLIFDNPLIERYRFSLLRPRQFGIYLAIYLLGVLILLLLVSHQTTLREAAKTLFYEFLGFQVVLLWIWAGNNTRTAIRDEISDKTYDFFRMLPLTAHQKAAGILVGKNLAALLFFALNLVFLVLLSFFAVSFYQFLQLIVLLACGAFCMNTVSLLAALAIDKQKHRGNDLAFLIFLFFMVPILIGLFGWLNLDRENDRSVCFYGFYLPKMLFISGVAVYVGIWSYVGIIRKFLKENESLFTRFGAAAFLFGCEIILLGLFQPLMQTYNFKGRLEGAFSFWGTGYLIMVLIALGSIRQFDSYWQASANWKDLPGERFKRKIFSYSNIGQAFLIFGIWMVFSLIQANPTRLTYLDEAGLIGIIFLSYLFLVLLIEIWVLYRQDSEKVNILLGAIYVTQVVLPMVCAGVFDKEVLLTGSPLGIFIYLCDGKAVPLGGMGWLLGYYLLLCSVPAVLVWRRWGMIQEVRILFDREPVLRSKME